MSIGSNIAEGFDRGNTREFTTFLGFAKGSAAEVRSQLYTAFDVGHITAQAFETLRAHAEEVSRLISGLLTHLRSTSIAGTRSHRANEEKL